MAIGSMTTNSTVDVIDKTLSIDGAPADAAAVRKLIEESIAAQREEDYARVRYWVSNDPTSPASFIGGTWERIEGKFIMGASDTYPAGSTGGEAEHTLTIEETPSHTHRILKMSWSGKDLDNSHNANYTYWGYDEQSTAPIGSQFISKVGGDQPHNNIPPYYSTYIWRRVA